MLHVIQAQAIEDKRLFLASGGDLGQTTDITKPGLQKGRWLSHFHASTCKNTAHQFAAKSFMQHVAAKVVPCSTRAVLCNLDCNNIMFPACPQAAMEAMATKVAKAQKQDPQLGSFVMVPPSNCGLQGGCTGRLLYFLEDFVASGGYDQEVGIYGTGYMVA